MDKTEFSRRVVGCEQKLFRIAYLTLGGERDREDAVQEALLKAWRGIASLREPAYFETWLVRILINECRTVQRRSRPMLEIPESLPMPDPPDPELRDALRALDIKYRLPIVLHHLEGYTVNEVARMMKLTHAMVRWRLEKGKLLLRRMLSGEVIE